MVISSGLPYAYHSGSWSGAETGKFRFAGQYIQPSAIHFEETMYALKSEYNRVVNKESGYRTQSAAPTWFVLNQGCFFTFFNNRTSGNFDPNPSGYNLGGNRSILHSTMNGDFYLAAKPGAIHQSGYITTMRELANFIFDYYGTRGSWATGSTAASRQSGVRKDILKIYKGYTDNYANSGAWFLGVYDVDNDTNEDTFRSGMYDRHIDELRLQPMPHFGVDGGISMTFLDHKSPWGNRIKMDQHDWPVIRPRYMMTSCTIPSGWASGIEIGRNNLTSPGTGIGGYLVSGIGFALSGTNNIYYMSGVYSGGMASETRPDSPSYCALTQVVPSGSTTVVSGQYKVILVHPNPIQLPAFPWGTGLNSITAVQWPWEGRYEPLFGTLTSTVGDFFDTNTKNQSFWVTDHVFAVQGDHGGTSQSPRLQSGIYWFQLNSGPSHSIALLDAWTQESAPAEGIVTSVLYQSGIQSLWGLSKWNNVRTQYAVGGAPTQQIFGAGWEYDRTNNYYVKVGYSGLSAASAEISGVYSRYNQQMKLIDGGIFPRVTLGSNNWIPTKTRFLSRDGTKVWLLTTTALSGSTTDPLASDSASAFGWLRLDSSLQIQDGILAKTDSFRAFYIAKSSEYIALHHSLPDELCGDDTPAQYYTLTSLTWGDLQNSDATGSGSYTKTTYNMTFDNSCWAHINQQSTGKLHIGTFFETEPDNQVYCGLVSFASGAASGNGNTPDYWIGKVDVSSHPYNCTNVWRLGSCGTTYSNIIAGGGLQVADIDIGNMAHLEIHVNG